MLKKNDSDTNLSNLGVLSLVLARGLTNLPSLVVSLLLVDIASSFDVQIGVAGQLRALEGGLSVIFALIMGVLSVKYKPKSLFSIGILIFAVSAITSFYSNSLTTLFLTYSIVGVAYSIVIPMINTIIGIHVPTEKRTTVIGWTVAGLSTLYLIGSLSVGYLSQWGWRTTLLLVVVPISIIIFTLSRIGISCLLYTSPSPRDRS